MTPKVIGAEKKSINYKCSDGIKASLSFKIFLQIFTDQNVRLPLYIDFFAIRHVGEKCYLQPLRETFLCQMRLNLKEFNNLGLLQVNCMKKKLTHMISDLLRADPKLYMIRNLLTAQVLGPLPAQY